MQATRPTDLFHDIYIGNIKVVYDSFEATMQTFKAYLNAFNNEYKLLERAGPLRRIDFPAQQFSPTKLHCFVTYTNVQEHGWVVEQLVGISFFNTCLTINLSHGPTSMRQLKRYEAIHQLYNDSPKQPTLASVPVKTSALHQFVTKIAEKNQETSSSSPSQLNNMQASKAMHEMSESSSFEIIDETTNDQQTTIDRLTASVTALTEREKQLLQQEDKLLRQISEQADSIRILKARLDELDTKENSRKEKLRALLD
jgi:hypothetical protein